MKYGKGMRSKLLPVVMGAMVPMLVAPAVTMVPGVVRADVKQAACKVHAVLAQREGDGKVPANLKFLEEQLADDQFAAFKSFRLLEAKSLKLEIGVPATAGMKTGHKLELELLGGANGRLELHAKLRGASSDKPLVSTDYTIDNKGVLIVGGVRHDQGKLFFAIQCSGS